jgi:hypothetical protein
MRSSLSIIFQNDVFLDLAQPVLGEKSLVANEERRAAELDMKLETCEHGLRGSSMTFPIMQYIT